MGNENAWWIALGVFVVMLVVVPLSRIPGLLFDRVSKPEYDDSTPPNDAP